MISPFQTTLLAVLAVAVVGWLMKALSGSSRDERIENEEQAARASGPRAVQGEEEEEEQHPVEPGPAFGGIAAVTSDGWAFMPYGEDVQVLPPGESLDTPDITGVADRDPTVPSYRSAGTLAPRTARPYGPGERLDRGDLVAARVVREAGEGGRWLLETLGRELDTGALENWPYRAWAFETEEAARAVLALLEERIVRPPPAGRGQPRPPADAAFAEARRLYEEAESALGLRDES